MLQCNAFSYWLRPYTECPLYRISYFEGVYMTLQTHENHSWYVVTKRLFLFPWMSKSSNLSFELTQWGRITYIYVSEVHHYRFRWWLVSSVMSSHYLNQCLLINTVWNKFQWNWKISWIKTNLKFPFAKWRQFWLDLNVLRTYLLLMVLHFFWWTLSINDNLQWCFRLCIRWSLGGEVMMTSSNGNIFRVNSHLCGEFTGPRWIPRTKTSDAELWCFLWSASE